MRIAILTTKSEFGGRIDHLFVYFGPQKLCNLIARLHESLSISIFNAVRGD